MKNYDSKKLYLKGVKNGIPIFLGYFAVSFTLGILAHDCGMTPWQAVLTSMTVNASAGQYAGFTLIAAHASYIEMAAMIFVANMRYMLMSASLSQKLDPKTGTPHRLLIGFAVTDEIFGTAIASPGTLRPAYYYGIMSSALPGWTLGTLLGIILGNVLPASIVSALSIALYAMFIAIIVPPARKHRLLAVLIAVSMGASYAFSRLPVLSSISGGTRTIILTVVIAGIAAFLFPVNKEVYDE